MAPHSSVPDQADPSEINTSDQDSDTHVPVDNIEASKTGRENVDVCFDLRSVRMEDWKNQVLMLASFNDYDH